MLEIPFTLYMYWVIIEVTKQLDQMKVHPARSLVLFGVSFFFLGGVAVQIVVQYCGDMEKGVEILTVGTFHNT